MTRQLSLAAWLLPLSLVLAQTAPTLPKGVERVTSVEGITEYRLDNGLKVLLFPDPTKNTITVNVTYLVGSRHENYGETGMAHLLEHLVFKGTPRHPDIPKELAAHGTRPNGTTWYDRTNYFETFAATEENLRWALDLEADRMVNSFIAKKDLDSEMTVVRNEYEAGENFPNNVLLQRTLATAFLWHNYGKSTIGSKADLENVPIDRLQAFYKMYYQPDNAVLLVAGQIDEAKTIQLVNEYFGKIPRPARKLQPTYTLDPVQDGERQVAVRRVGDVQLIAVVYHSPDAAHPDMAALDVLADMMSRPPAGRLYKALVEAKKAASVGGFQFRLKEPGVVIFTAQVRKENSLDEARDVMLKTVEEFAANPPSKEEIERSKTEILKQIELALNDNTRVGLMLSEPIAAGDWRLFFLYRDRVRNATPEDVLRAGKAYLKPANRTLGLFIPTEKPDRAEIPPASDLVSMLRDYKGGEIVAQGEAFDPSIENISKRTVKGTLGNGMKLVFVPKRTRGNKVNAALTLRYGDVKSVAAKGSAPNLAAAMMMRGTAKHTRQQITDELARLKAQVSIFGGSTSTRVNIESVRQNLPDVMKLVAEMLREAAFLADEFDRLKQEQLAQQEQFRREPQALAMSALNQHLNPYPKDDPRYVRTPDENIASLQAATVESAKQFYQDFYGASNSELVVVGDFDPEQMQTMASSLFGAWKSPKPFAKVQYPYQKIAAGQKVFETPDKANAMIAVGMPLQIGDEHQDYPALVLGNYILGSGMNSRLFRRIRQKEGLSYGTGSMLMGRPKQDSGVFMAMAIFAPQNVIKVETALKEEVAGLLKDGVTEAELAEAKKGWLQGQTVSRAQDNELANLLTGLAFENRDLQFQADLEKKVSVLTAQQIVEAMRRHVHPEQLSIFKAGDFAKAGVKP
jgi:zinc protease